jgi:hypothetical protein
VDVGVDALLERRHQQEGNDPGGAEQMDQDVETGRGLFVALKGSLAVRPGAR